MKGVEIVFREVARKKQVLTHEECLEILKTAPRGVLSVIGDDGYPYGTPINHLYCEEEGKIYFHCAKEGHKLDAITKCDKASYCVMDEGYREGDDWALNIKSVIIFGRARFVEFSEEPEKVREICIGLSAKFTDDPNYADDEIAKVGRNVLCIEITPDHMTGKLVNEA